METSRSTTIRAAPCRRIAAVAAFKAPQLPLEALIAFEGHFDGLASRRIVKLAYISAKGGDPAGSGTRDLTKSRRTCSPAPPAKASPR